MNGMRRDELNRKVCGRIVRGGSAAVVFVHGVRPHGNLT